MFRNMVPDFTDCRLCENFVYFVNQSRHFGNELNQSFRYENHAVVFTELASLADDVCNIGGHLRQGLLFFLYLFTN